MEAVLTRNIGSFTRHQCFISYHHDDEQEVEQFIDRFDHAGDIFISRGIGAGMLGDIVNSDSSDYIMRRVREKYLSSSTITIVMVGRCTWARKYVDWEIAASLRNSPNSTKSGLMGIALPSMEGNGGKLPARLADNTNGQFGYARWWKYPQTLLELATMIDIAYETRQSGNVEPDNSRDLFSNNRACQ